MEPGFSRTPAKPPPDATARERVLAELRREAAARRAGYRERALKLLPHVCASCGRLFSGKRLRELTVHHKDHNHDNNPPDGSNWELLCGFCHDNEHQKELEHARMQRAFGKDYAPPPAKDTTPPLTHRPFANLTVLLDGRKKG